MYQQFLSEALEIHKRGDFNRAITMYNQLLNRLPDDRNVAFLLADAYLRIEHNGLAINLLKNIITKHPKWHEAWCNLGVGYRKENFLEEAKNAWKKAISIEGDSVEVCGNMASLYADQGHPKEAIKWSTRAMNCDPTQPEPYWQTSLAKLSIRDWKEGWKLYEYRQKLSTWDSRKSIKCPIWNGEKVGHLYIHGEQGVGDEVMFASCLNDVKTLADKITIEVNPKVAELIKITWPEFEVVTKEQPGDYDAKVAIGSLACMFRNSDESFSGEPFIKPNPSRVEFYRKELAKLGNAPYVAVAWIGGTKQTRVENRSIPITELKPLFENFTCVSAQYSNENPYIEEERKMAGLPKINDESCGGDLAEQAALFAACDYVVTVQQTAVHVAGSVGTPTLALIAHNPQWRYGIEGETLPWYKSVKLLRKKEKEDWKRVINEATDEILTNQRKVA